MTKYPAQVSNFDKLYNIVSMADSLKLVIDKNFVDIQWVDQYIHDRKITLDFVEGLEGASIQKYKQVGQNNGISRANKILIGSRGRTRTYDQAVNSRPLYHWATREYRGWLLLPVPKRLFEKRELIPASQLLFVFYLSIAV